MPPRSPMRCKLSVVGDQFVYTGEALSAYADPYSNVADDNAHAVSAAEYCHAAGPGHAGTMRLAELRGPANAVLWQLRCGTQPDRAIPAARTASSVTP
jgi:hypothetical protein